MGISGNHLGLGPGCKGDGGQRSSQNLSAVLESDVRHEVERCHEEASHHLTIFLSGGSGSHLFPKLKEHLGGLRFTTDDEVKEEVTRFLKGLAGEFYNMGIEKLEHRLQKCLDRNGDYVEK